MPSSISKYLQVILIKISALFCKILLKFWQIDVKSLKNNILCHGSKDKRLYSSHFCIDLICQTISVTNKKKHAVIKIHNLEVKFAFSAKLNNVHHNIIPEMRIRNSLSNMKQVVHCVTMNSVLLH